MTLVFVFWPVLAPSVWPETDRPQLSSLSFEQQISRKLHNPLVIRMKASTVKNQRTTTFPTCDTTSINNKIQAAFPAAKVTLPPCQESKSRDVIVAGTIHKNAILDTYEATHKSGTKHVVTRIKGKRSPDAVLNPCNVCGHPVISIIGSRNWPSTTSYQQSWKSITGALVGGTYSMLQLLTRTSQLWYQMLHVGSRLT